MEQLASLEVRQPTYVNEFHSELKTLISLLMLLNISIAILNFAHDFLVKQVFFLTVSNFSYFHENGPSDILN